MYRWIKNRLRNYVAGIAAKEANRAAEEVYARLPQLIAFHTAGPEEKQEAYDQTKDPERHLEDFARQRSELAQRGVQVEDLRIETADFEQWMADFSALRLFYDRTMGSSAVQKCMEHYIAYSYLHIRPGEVYIDIAAQRSPWSDCLKERGVKAYRLDLDYPSGIHGTDIGADACETGLPDGFADVMSSQCAFNCFAGDADTRFLREASRILKPGGRFAALPLCIGDTYCIFRSPYCDLQHIVFDRDAKLVWRTDPYRLPFSRQYTPAAFQERLIARMPSDLRGKVLFISNLGELMAHFEGQRIYGAFVYHLQKAPSAR